MDWKAGHSLLRVPWHGYHQSTERMMRHIFLLGTHPKAYRFQLLRNERWEIVFCTLNSMWFIMIPKNLSSASTIDLIKFPNTVAETKSKPKSSYPCLSLHDVMLVTGVSDAPIGYTTRVRSVKWNITLIRESRIWHSRLKLAGNLSIAGAAKRMKWRNDKDLVLNSSHPGGSPKFARIQ